MVQLRHSNTFAFRLKTQSIGAKVLKPLIPIHSGHIPRHCKRNYVVNAAWAITTLCGFLISNCYNSAETIPPLRCENTRTSN